ncbi:MAG: GYD domain-containing protein [Chloroflexi bacterium]|nr:MAG: GYD domain-containing protein [Chloroflexota bacterium]
MPTYIALLNYTEKGIQSIKDLPKRVEKAREVMGRSGVKMTSLYLTMGRYDAISIFEAPDDAAVAKVLLAIAGFGNVRTETMRAFDEAETSAIVGSL